MVSWHQSLFCLILLITCLEMQHFPKENFKSVIKPYGVNFFVDVRFLQEFSPRAEFVSKAGRARRCDPWGRQCDLILFSGD